MILRLCMFIVISVWSCPSSQAAPLDPEALVKASLAFSEQEQEPLAGLSVAIYSHGKPLFVKGFGWAHTEKKSPVDKDTVFRIGSITKQFTVAGIMLLVEQNKLKVTDPVAALLPDYSGIPKDITIEQLMAHTSGLFNYTALPNWNELENKPMSRQELVRLFVEKPLDFKPGEGWNYSNSGYYLLGLVIEKVSGLSYQDYVKERLINKAKLSHTGYCSPEWEQQNAAKGYLVDKGKWVDAAPMNLDHPYAAGGLCSTAEDLALWSTALMRGEIVQPKSLALMTTPIVRKNRKKTSSIELGWGFMVSEEMGHRFVGSGGGTNGFINTLDTYPDDELVVAMLGNTESNTQIMLAISLARAALGLIKDEPMTEAEGKALEGTYRSVEGDEAFRLKWDKAQLLCTRLEQGKPVGPSLRLLAQGNDRFIINENSALVSFERVAGKVTRATVLHMGGEQAFAKSNNS